MPQSQPQLVYARSAAPGQPQPQLVYARPAAPPPQYATQPQMIAVMAQPQPQPQPQTYYAGISRAAPAAAPAPQIATQSQYAPRQLQVPRRPPPVIMPPQQMQSVPPVVGGRVLQSEEHGTKLRSRSRSPPPAQRRTAQPDTPAEREYSFHVPKLLAQTQLGFSDLRGMFERLYVVQDFARLVICTTEGALAQQVGRRVAIKINKTDATPEQLQQVATAVAAAPPTQHNGVAYNVKVLLTCGIPAVTAPSADRKEGEHVRKQLKFLVGNKDKSLLAFGGAWNAGLDGEDPTAGDSALIHTAVRTVKDALGVDLSGCKTWTRFFEVWYDRAATDKTLAFKEVTVIFVPSVADIASPPTAAGAEPTVTVTYLRNKQHGSKGAVRPMVLSLDGILEYNEEDTMERTFEVSLFGEFLSILLSRNYARVVLSALEQFGLGVSGTQTPALQTGKRKLENEQLTTTVATAAPEKVESVEKSEPSEAPAEKRQKVEETAPVESSTTTTTKDATEMKTTEESPAEAEEEKPAQIVSKETAIPPVAEVPNTSATDELQAALAVACAAADSKPAETTLATTTTMATTTTETPSQQPTPITQAPAKESTQVTEVVDAKKAAVEIGSPDLEVVGAFQFFDRNLVGYLRTSDVEAVVHSLGSFLCRRYVHVLVTKTCEQLQQSAGAVMSGEKHVGSRLPYLRLAASLV